MGELVALANRRGGPEGAAPDFAALAPVVARCAEEGDALAGSVLYGAGNELAGLVRRVFVQGSPDMELGAGFRGLSEIEVAYTGSVLERIGAVRAAMVKGLRTSVPLARVREGAVDPLEGALWRARKAGC